MNKSITHSASCSSAGDLGDVLASLATLKATGLMWDYYLLDRDFCKKLSTRAHVIAPLIESQPYIRKVHVKEKKTDWPSEDFRKYYSQFRSLADSHAVHAADFGFEVPIPASTEPWLTVKPDARSNDRVVIARSARYHNQFFPWKEIVNYYQDRLMFVGLDEEYSDFCDKFGQVPRTRTQTLLDVSELIAGSLLFIGNQSSPWWCSEGLKHSRIQETHLRQCDSMMLGGEVQHVADGGVTLPSFDKGRDPLILKPALPPVNIHIQTNNVPKTYFEIGEFRDKLFGRVLSYAQRTLKMTEYDAKVAILTDMSLREPQYFGGSIENQIFDVYNKAKLKLDHTSSALLTQS